MSIMGIKSKLKNMFSTKTVPILVNNEGTLLSNRTALITGGGSGIGLSIAKEFSKQGCKVIIAGRNVDKLKDACLHIPNSSFVVLDISDTSKINSVVDDLFNRDKIDILVNNAGIHYNNKFLYVTEKEFDEIFNINVKGTYFLSQAVAKKMIELSIKGNILNISSTSGIRPAWGPYQMSKWAINGFTKGFADKLLQYDIIVNAIAPGQTATDMMKTSKDNLTNEGTMCGRFIMPEEIACTAVFLVSGFGKSIVGDTIYVAGGSGIIDSRR